ncbi:general amino-acid permease Gap1p [Trichomonascus vanleenenianus]|uniref:amino acid permease n=1 Tax=Trichomonascus vanleenenianus TaxID=2268995 RepID=UPI003ECABE36
MLFRMSTKKKRTSQASSGSSDENIYGHIVQEHTKEPKWYKRFADSFKPAHDTTIHSETATLSDLERAALASAASPLSRKLRSRHLQMIAIGGSIGTGLFIGSGAVLHFGGPASLIISYTIVGLMLYCTMQALGELAVLFPVSGAFAAYSARFIDPAWGFAMGWNYAVQWLVVLPVELVAASIAIRFWKSDINSVAWVAIFYVIVVTFNLFGVRGYGETEFVFSIIKIIAIVGFIILGIVINVGGGPNGAYIGGKYWHDPGAFAGNSPIDNLKRVCSTFAAAAFSFTGTELAGLAAAETENPRKSLPAACKQVFWRITLFYLISLTLVGLLVPYTNDRLLDASPSNPNITASPFVIAIENAGIKVLPSIFNVVIIIAVLSVGNSAVYGCSRTLSSLADLNLAPRWLGYIDRNGRPLVAILITSAFGLLCFLSASDNEEQVFEWLMALTGLSLIFTWGSVCVCHIRFRRAFHIQNRDPDEIPYRSQVGIYGSMLGLLINVLVLIAQLWVAISPVPGDGEPGARLFFQKYLAAFIIAVCYIGFKVIMRPPFVRCKDMDLITGRREIDLGILRQETAEEKQYLEARGYLYRVYKWWC